MQRLVRMRPTTASIRCSSCPVAPSALTRGFTVRTLPGESKGCRPRGGNERTQTQDATRGMAPRRRTDGCRVESKIERPEVAAQTAVTGHRGSFSCKQVVLRGGAALLQRSVENKEKKKVKYLLRSFLFLRFECKKEKKKKSYAASQPIP